jgi:hypothetical protein
MASEGHALPGPPGGEAQIPEATREARPWSVAWFAGVDLDILARVPSEQTFYRRLGAGVLLVSCASGLAFTSALAYALDASLFSVLWAGIAWAVLLACGVEPLVLQISPTKRKLVLAAGISWRVLFSILLALQLSEPLILRLNEPEINNQLLEERVDREAAQLTANRDLFNPTIERNKDELKDLREAVNGASHNLAMAQRERAKALEEAGICESSCQFWGERAAGSQKKKEEAVSARKEKEPKLVQERDRFQQQRGEGLRDGKEKIEEKDGIWARIGALEQIASSSTAQNAEVWALRLLFLLLDLLPLTAKVYRILTVDSPYEMQLAASRREEATAVAAREAISDVNEEMIREQARADVEVGRAEIHTDTERRLGEVGLGGDGAERRGDDPNVSAWNLSGFVEEMKFHDDQPVTVPAELRQAALGGSFVLGAGMILGSLVASLAGISVKGLWLLVLAFAAVASLAAYTHGFRRAPAWALRAVLATVIGGFLLPLVVLGVNLL